MIYLVSWRQKVILEHVNLAHSVKLWIDIFATTER